MTAREPSLDRGWQLPAGRGGRVLLIVLATIGASLLAVAVTGWMFAPHDETAYWEAAQRLIAGQPLYDPNAVANKPFAYWYPPPLAQLLAPFTLVLPLGAYIAAFTIGMLGCLWWLSGRRPLVALAMIAFPPVAVELTARNAHLYLAVLVVLALRRSPLWWVVATAIKVTPVLGVLYLVLRRQWRDAALVVAVGLAVVAVSVALSPGAWHDFVDVLLVRGASPGGDSLVPVPSAVRLLAGVLLVVLAARLGGIRGEVLLVCALTIASATLWLNAFTILLAIVPLAMRQADPSTASGPLGRAAAATDAEAAT